MADRIVRPQREFEVREIDDAGVFSGYASVFGVKDTYGTVFDKGAFKKTLRDHKGWLPLVWMHDPSEPIGRALVEEDETGLMVKEGRLDLDVQRGAEVYSGMKKGYITEMSHSFASIRDATVKDSDGDEVLHYKEVRSFEISPVTANFASNDEAEITSVRTEEQEPPRILTIPDEMKGQMERLEALLKEPPTGTQREPQGKPGDHLQAFQRESERVLRLMRGE
jgi:HK97 family phage prohead protease